MILSVKILRVDLRQIADILRHSGDDSNNDEHLFINLATVPADEYLLSRLQQAIDVMCNAKKARI